MIQKKNWTTVLINIVYILAMIVVIAPLLWNGLYNYPSADDWSYGRGGYQALQSGGNILDVLKASMEMSLYTYMNVEGKFVGFFLATLQPGIWGEQYYAIVVWIMLGAVLGAGLFLAKGILCDGCRNENRWMWLPVVAPVLIMQIMYCPSPEESFYWYTGAMSYTFSYALSLVVYVLFLRLATRNYEKVKYAFVAGITTLLAFMVGGMNFGTSLSTFLGLCILTLLFVRHEPKVITKVWMVPFSLGGALVMSVLAPGNTNRIDSNFGGETQGAVWAVIMSLIRSFTNIVSWTRLSVILMLALMIPFAWVCVKNMKYSFKYPGVFTILTFGLYASQSTPTMFINGTTGGGRMEAVLYYTYHIFMLINLIYWLGWLSRRQNRLQKLAELLHSRGKKWLLPYCAMIGIMLIGIVYVTDLKQLTGYRAYRNYCQGWAEQYAKEWQARIEVLHDPTVKDVVFSPISVYPEMIQYTDLQPEDGYTWVNYACAQYYGKASVTVKKAE